MPGASWTQPNFETQDSTSYKTSIDNCFQIAERACRGFAPREMDSPSLKVWVDAGYAFYASSGSLLSISATASPLFITPETNNRIDRLVTSIAGTLTVVSGVPDASPSPPAVTANTYPVCQVSLTTGTTAIINSLITDERISGVLTVSASVHGVEKFTSTGTWTCPAGVTTIWVTASAGGGGSASAYVAAGGAAAGGGGDAGAVVFREEKTVVPGTAYTVTIGAGGAGGAPGGNNNGAAGGSTTISGGILSLAGGAGGVANAGIVVGSSLVWGQFGGGSILAAVVRTVPLQSASGAEQPPAGDGYGGGAGGAAVWVSGGAANGGSNAGASGVVIIEW